MGIYSLEHVEGSQLIVVRRPEGSGNPICPPLEYVRAALSSRVPPLCPTTREKPLLRPWAGTASRHSRERSVPLKPSNAIHNGGSSHELDFREFCSKNELSDRVIGTLQSLDWREQRHIMGLDGGKNSFKLTGVVRDPNAVVMSRIKRLQQEPCCLEEDRHQVCSRSRSRWAHRSRSSSSCSSSRSRSCSCRK